MKTCNLCKQQLPLDQFHKMKASPDGHGYTCKPCAIARTRAYEKANREKILRKNRDYYQKNKERMLQRNAAHRREHTDKIAAVHKAYYTENRERLLAQYRDYRRSEKAKATKRAAHKRERIKFREKMNTRSRTRRAIKRGILVRPDICSRCERACKPEANHYKGYASENYLDVQWLCGECHRIIEGRQGAIK